MAVMAFEPHPREFFAPKAPSFRLTMPETRARLLERHGVDLAFILPFDKAFAEMEARAFVGEVLASGLGVAEEIEKFFFHIPIVDVERRDAGLEGSEHPLDVLVAVVAVDRQVILPGFVAGQFGSLVSDR